ncbi:GGDEF domain-containing protein [Leucobacter sp. W1478]|uniref:GGDEF domain-containing protein n=1 Tax=Leucobacter sp. W1478 TaxID=3439065 RepID=UPI003F323DBA
MSGDTIETQLSAGARSAQDRTSEAAQAELLRRAPVGLMTIDLQGKVIAHNDMLALWRGWAPDEAPGALIGENALGWLSAESRERCVALLSTPALSEQQFREIVIDGKTMSGDLAPIILNADLVADESGQMLVHVALIDATERGRFERELIEARRSADRANDQLHDLQERLRHQALHDPLTGLANQALLEEQLGRMLLAATRSEKPCAVIYLDLDGFRSINQECGHAVGDELLRIFGRRIQSVCPDGGIVSRLGGDEYGLALGPTDDSELRALTERILEQARLPLRELIGDRPLSASIGAVLWAPRPGEGAPLARDFIAAADQAMYAAKRSGKNRATQCMWSDIVGKW